LQVSFERLNKNILRKRGGKIALFLCVAAQAAFFDVENNRLFVFVNGNKIYYRITMSALDYMMRNGFTVAGGTHKSKRFGFFD
jgi:hypothetical protein